MARLGMPLTFVSKAKCSCLSGIIWQATEHQRDAMRLPLIAPSDLTSEQRPIYEDMRAGIAKVSRDSAASTRIAR
jgi:hypothetical protein